MASSSLTDRIRQLEDDIKQSPPAFILYRDLPFAIFRYDPDDEWTLRRELRLLITRLAQAGKQPVTISMAELLWESIAKSEGLDALVEYERQSGFPAAQAQVTTYLSQPVWSPLADMLADRLRPLDPARHIAFITHVGALGPDIYPASTLLEELYEHALQVPSVLFYPGTVDAATGGLRFLNLHHRVTTGNYRVKIYE
jgi:hypothetical protein